MRCAEGLVRLTKHGHRLACRSLRPLKCAQPGKVVTVAAAAVDLVREGKRRPAAKHRRRLHHSEIEMSDADIERHVDEIVDRFPPGGFLAEEDADYLRQILRARKGPIDLAIYTLGRAGEEKDISLVQQFLQFQGDYGVPSRALRTLCFWLDRPEPYILRIISGINRETWDDLYIHRNECIRIAQDVLGEQYHQSIVDTLIRLLGKSDDSRLIRSIYLALIRADGIGDMNFWKISQSDFVEIDDGLIRRLKKGKHSRR